MVTREARRIEGQTKSQRTRLAKLEEALDELGYLDAAERHVEALLRARAAWAGPDDFSRVEITAREQPGGWAA